MITKAMLNSLDGETVDLANLLDALDMIAWELEQPIDGPERQTLNALQGTVTAARKQIKQVHAGIGELMAAQRGNGDMAKGAANAGWKETRVDSAPTLAERRIGELMAAQRDAVGTAQGRRSDLGFSETQVASAPVTLAEAGIDKEAAE